jgi:hypothetical protein
VRPSVRARRPAPGRHHPASAADIRAKLAALGEAAYYGVKSIELVPCPVSHMKLVFGRLVAPGEIVLYDQPYSPWQVRRGLVPEVTEILTAAGATVDDDCVVAWPRGSLRRFMLDYVLPHELAHHALQHERRLRNRRGARKRDHEARAELMSARSRRSHR